MAHGIRFKGPKQERCLDSAWRCWTKRACQRCGMAFRETLRLRLRPDDDVVEAMTTGVLPSGAKAEPLEWSKTEYPSFLTEAIDKMEDVVEGRLIAQSLSAKIGR